MAKTEAKKKAPSKATKAAKATHAAQSAKKADVDALRSCIQKGCSTFPAIRTEALALLDKIVA